MRLDLVMAAAGVLIGLAVITNPSAAVLGVTIGGVLAVLLLSTTAPVAVFIVLVTTLPKLPLIAIRGYMVPVRIEDVFFAAALAVLLFRMVVVEGQPQFHSLVPAMLAFFCVEGVSLAVGVSFLGTISNPLVGVLYWLRSAEYFLASVFTFCAVRTWRQFRLVLGAFVVSVMLIGIYGMLQEFSLVPVFNAMHMGGEIVTLEYIEGFGTARLFSTFGGPYELGAFYLIAIPVLVALMMCIGPGRKKVYLGGIVLLSLVCLYLTYARAPLISLAVSLGVVLWLMGRKRFAVFAACIIPCPAVFIPEFRERLEFFFRGPFHDRSLYDRVAGEWVSAMRGFLRFPILGTGPSSVGNGMGVDGLYLLLLGMTGVVGLIVFLRVVQKAWIAELFIAKKARGRVLRGVAVGLVGATVGLLLNGFTQDTFFSSKVAFTYWFLAGLVLAGARIERDGVMVERQRPRERV